MSDCYLCSSEKACRYPYKPCDCVGQRKFWDEKRREEWDREELKRLEKTNTIEKGDDK